MRYINLVQLLRSLKQRWFYTTLNITGLGIGLGCSLLMAIYIVHEYSYDKFGKNSDIVYRVVNGNNIATSYAMGDAFKSSVPGIDQLFRMQVRGNVRIKYGQEFIEEESLVYSENAMLDMLDMKIVFGEKEQQLQTTNTIMISESLAQRYFPDENPLGKSLELAVSNKLMQFQISGVFEDFSLQSSIQTDLITNIENEFSNSWDLAFSLGASEEKEQKDYRSDWGLTEFATFVALQRRADQMVLAEKCTEICNQHGDTEKDNEIWFQPLSQIYLHSSNLEGNFYFASNNFDSLKIFMGIGLLILLVAIINFILISNADNNVYIKEIACRKVNGASRKQITIQQLFKSVMLAIISLVPASLFIWLVMPVFNRLFDKNLEFSLVFQWQYLLVLFLLTILTGVLAGIYLSLVVSKFNPVSLFQKQFNGSLNHSRYKGALVVVQFVVFIFLANCFFSMYRQYQFTLKKDIGLETENIISFSIGDKALMSQINVLQGKVGQNPHVLNCKASSFTTPPNGSVIFWGYKEQETGESKTIQTIFLGKGVIDLLGIDLIQGNTFDGSVGNFSNRVLANQTAAKEYGLVAGDQFEIFEILGIVDDFNINSLHSKLQPTFIVLQTNNLEYFLVKTDGNIGDVVNNVREICNAMAPGYFVDYELLDDKVAEFYKKEEKQMGTIGFFAAIAMGLSVLGLLGFVALNLVKMTKEIGVRKINGAFIKDLVVMINGQYMLWISMAFLLATPISYIVMQKWLQQFAYKINLSWWMYGLVGILALFMTLITVSFQSWRAATRNPVEALRYE